MKGDTKRSKTTFKTGHIPASLTHRSKLNTDHITQTIQHQLFPEEGYQRLPLDLHDLVSQPGPGIQMEGVRTQAGVCLLRPNPPSLTAVQKAAEKKDPRYIVYHLISLHVVYLQG